MKCSEENILLVV